MNGRFQVWAPAAVAILAVSGVVIRGVAAQSGSEAPAHRAKLAEQQYKNIQVLKGIPADQLIPAMQFITASLGVECEFCHVEGAFEKDDKKPKQVARKMMEMMITINQENFDSKREVTCYSCHRGNIKPLVTPVVAVGAKDDGASRATESDSAKAGGPTADQLFDKYIQASGGTSAVAKITSRVEKGTIEFGGHSFPIDIYTKDPDKRISFTHMPQGDNITAFNGQEGWLAAPGRPVREMHGPDLDGAAIDADLHFALHLKDMFSEAKAEQPEEIDGHKAYLVVGKRDAKPPLRLYFDEQSGLLVRLVRFGDTPLGLLPTQIDYADYHELDGVRVPFRWTLARSMGIFTIQAQEVKQNVLVDDAKFSKPAEPPQEPGSPK
jgi:photosynthetic reaction center cytochrome c subunit